jgi:N-acetyl-gamma-glutamyl-phosphate reductase
MLETPDLIWRSLKRRKIAIIGATGYAGEQLCALFCRHPGIEIAALSSRTHAGKAVGEVLPRLASFSEVKNLIFCAPEIGSLLATDAEFFFLALPHGLASAYAGPFIESGRRVVDLSADFRLRDVSAYEEFYGMPHPAAGMLREAAYGIPEIYREAIRHSKLVAVAGCYPTSILLPLVPLLRDGLVNPTNLIASSSSGVSGAGRNPNVSLLYAECSGSFRAYGLPKHRHLSEIEQELSLAGGQPTTVTFVPHVAPMTRGIHTTIFASPSSGMKLQEIEDGLRATYEDEYFVRLEKRLPDTKYVSGTNFCDIAIRYDERTGQLILLSAIDNLVKGAAGQAVQSFNVMAGFDERLALI